jgi:hypothetical protein
MLQSTQQFLCVHTCVQVYDQGGETAVLHSVVDVIGVYTSAPAVSSNWLGHLLACIFVAFVLYLALVRAASRCFVY